MNIDNFILINIIITNSVNIGKDVVAGDGAVITKDIPDYAVVSGVPVRFVHTFLY